MTALYTLPPLQIIDHPADAEHCGGEPRLGYRYIVLHSTANPDASGLNSLEWLSRSPGSRVSCHRYIPKSGMIYKLVPDEVVAWTQGPSELRLVPDNQPDVNQWCLSIEMENKDDGHDPYPLQQVRSCAWQVAEWIGAHSVWTIVAHAWIQSNKGDPAGFPWDLFYKLLDARVAIGVRIP